MKKENWGKGIIEKVDESLVNTRDKDIRFFRIDEFKRNIERVHKFSTDCGYCNRQKIDIADAVDIPGKKRREYDRLISRLSSHMRKEHGFFPPFYFSYLYALFGFIGGFLIGFVLSLFFPENKSMMYTISFSFCIVGTYIIGSQKDLKIRLKKKLM